MTREMAHFGTAVLFACSLGLATGRSATETPPRSQMLRLARTTDPATLDPELMETSEDLMLWPLLYLPLLDVTHGTHLEPCAARAWSASPDERRFTLLLRPGMRFSNGRDVVAADYVYALERMLNPATAAGFEGYYHGIRGAKAFIAGATNHVAGLSAPDKDTLIVDMERSDPTFPYLLGNVTAVPREEAEQRARAFAVRPLGDGPYVLQEWVRGARLRFARNPNYHGPEAQHLEGVDIRIGGDETTLLMMFERGELDWLPYPFSSFRRLANDPRWRGQMEQETLMGTDYLSLNTEVPPLNNVLVRRAINHALDRDRRMRVTQGFTSHAEGVIPPNMPGYNPELRGYDYDPAQARSLLRQSGLALPLHTELWFEESEDYRTEAQGFQWDLHQVGIEAELKEVAGSQMTPAMQTRRRVPIAFWGWYVALPDPVDILGTQFDGHTVDSAETMNFSHYNNAEVNELLAAAAPEVDLPTRFAEYQRAEEIIVRDAPWVFLSHPKYHVLRQPWLKGPLLEPLWLARLDRVWIE